MVNKFKDCRPESDKYVVEYEDNSLEETSSKGSKLKSVVLVFLATVPFLFVLFSTLYCWSKSDTLTDADIREAVEQSYPGAEVLEIERGANGGISVLIENKGKHVFIENFAVETKPISVVPGTGKEGRFNGSMAEPY